MKVTLKDINLSIPVIQETIKKDMKATAAFLFLSLIDEVNDNNLKFVEAYNKCTSQEERDELLATEVEITHSIPKDLITFDISPAGLILLKPFIS